MLPDLKVSSLEYKRVFYRPEHNTKRDLHGIESLVSWNGNMIYTIRESSKNRWESEIICLDIMFTRKIMVIKMSKMFSVDDSKQLVTVWPNYSTALERTYWVISENGMVNRLWSYFL